MCHLPADTVSNIYQLYLQRYIQLEWDKVQEPDLGGCAGDCERDLDSLSLSATRGRCWRISTTDGFAAAATCPEDRTAGFTTSSSDDDDEDEEDDDELERPCLSFIFSTFADLSPALDGGSLLLRSSRDLNVSCSWLFLGKVLSETRLLLVDGFAGDLSRTFCRSSFSSLGLDGFLSVVFLCDVPSRASESQSFLSSRRLLSEGNLDLCPRASDFRSSADRSCGDFSWDLWRRSTSGDSESLLSDAELERRLEEVFFLSSDGLACSLDCFGDDEESENAWRSAFFGCFGDELDLRRWRECDASSFLLFSGDSRRSALDLDFVSDLVSRVSFFVSELVFLSRFLSGDCILDDELYGCGTGDRSWSEDWSCFTDRGGDLVGASSIGFWDATTLRRSIVAAAVGVGFSMTADCILRPFRSDDGLALESEE